MKTKRNAKAYEAPSMSLKDLGGPGAYRFIYEDEDDGGEPIGIYHGCPCGCGVLGTIFFKEKGWADPGHGWSVEGDWPNVTLSPSIGINMQPGGEYHWHGWLRNGIFEEV